MADLENVFRRAEISTLLDKKATEKKKCGYLRFLTSIMADIGMLLSMWRDWYFIRETET